MAKFKPGHEVEWRWPPGTVRGTVVESFEHRVQRKIKGSLITRNGTPDNPAYLLRTRKGVDVLKLESELIDVESMPGGKSVSNRSSGGGASKSRAQRASRR